MSPSAQTAKEIKHRRGAGKPALRLEFAAWLTDPLREGTQSDWAHAHKVDQATLSEWKKTPEVREKLLAWRDSFKPAFGEVANAMFRKGIRGDVQAARLIGDWLGEGKTSIASAGDSGEPPTVGRLEIVWPEYDARGKVVTRPAV